MKFGKLLLASTALAMLASGQSTGAGSVYFSVTGGLNFQDDPDDSFRNGPTFFGGFFSTSVMPNSDSGYVLGAAVGAHLDDWIPGLRAELEGTYRHNDLSGKWAQTGTFIGPTFRSGHIEGDSTTWAVMANAWYDFPVSGKFVPYIGGGIGWAKTKDEGTFVVDTGTIPNSNFKTDDSGFAWQLGAGINFELSDNARLGLGYRYFESPSVDPVFFGKNAAPVDFKDGNHSVALTLTIDLN